MKKAIHVLIVDDDSSIWIYGCPTCSSRLHDLQSIQQFRSFLTTLKEEQIDVLVSDIKMPEMSGLELLEKSQSPLSTTSCYLPSYGTIPDAVDAVKAGALDYLTKPFDGKELVRKIENILPSSHRNKQWLHLVKWRQASSREFPP